MYGAYVCSVIHKSETVLTMQRNKLRVILPPATHCNTTPSHSAHPVTPNTLAHYLSTGGCSVCYHVCALTHSQAPMFSGEDTPTLKFVEISAERIANQITVIEHEVLQRIKPL